MTTARRASALGRPLLRAVVFATLLLAGCAVSGFASLFAPSGGLLALLALIGVGVAWPASGIFARPILAARTSRPEIALTFDDGPDPHHTAAILDTLARTSHRATFFVVGRRAANHLELLRRIVSEGHALGNHSLRHHPFTTLTPPAKLAAELEQTQALLTAAGEQSRFFRAPVGLLSPRVARAAALAGLDLVGWSGTARDGVTRRTPEDGLARLRRHLKPGAILVLHDGPATTIGLPILERLLPELDRRGLRSVTLTKLLSP